MCHAIEDTGRRFLGVMLVARNLGFLSHVHSTLNYSRKLAALGRLMAGVAHEVKNPLNAMTIHLELLKQKLAAVPEPITVPNPAGGTRQLDLTKHVKVIADEIRRLDRVVVGFLKFARPEELRLQPVQLSTIISEVVSMSAPEAAQRGITVRVECPPSLPDINADPGMLQQAVLNLALNACQAMPSGGALQAVVPVRTRTAGSRSTSKTPASAFRRKISERSSIFTSRPRTPAPASACRWSSASSSCTTARWRSNRRPDAGRGSAWCSHRRRLGRQAARPTEPTCIVRS